MEAVLTNVNGTDNVIRAAIDNKVQRMVLLSTDKMCIRDRNGAAAVWVRRHLRGRVGS